MASFADIINYGGLNPMDFVTGYERGIDIGRKRQIGEQAQIQTEIMRTRDLPQARVSGLLSEAELQAMRNRRADLQQTLETGISTQASRARQTGAITSAQEETLPGRLSFYRQSEKQAESMIPERLQRQRDVFRQQGEELALRGERTGQQRLQIADQAEARAIQTDYDQAIQKARSDPNNADLPDDELVRRAQQYATNPKTRTLIQLQVDRYAGNQLSQAAYGGNVEQMNYWMRRLNKPYQIELGQIETPQGPQAVYNVRTFEPQVDEQGRVTAGAGELVWQFSIDPNDPRSAAQQLPSFLGLGGGAPQTGAQRRAPARTRAPKKQPENPVGDATTLFQGTQVTGPGGDLTTFTERQTRSQRETTAANRPALSRQDNAVRIAEYLRSPEIQAYPEITKLLADAANKGVPLDPNVEAYIQQIWAAGQKPRSIGERITELNAGLTGEADARRINRELLSRLQQIGA